MHRTHPHHQLRTHSWHASRLGFSLIEMALVLSGIGIVVAGLVWAVNPGQQYTNSQNVIRQSNVKELVNAELDKWKTDRRYSSDNRLNIGAETALPICARGNPDDYCVPFDDLISSGYLSSMPGDSAEQCPHWSGYSAYLDTNLNLQVVANHDEQTGTPSAEDMSKCGYTAGYAIDTLETDNSTDVMEDSYTDTVLVKLDKQPSDTVTVTLSAANGKATLHPSTLTFTPNNWGKYQTVTVTAVQDGLTTGPHTDAIKLGPATSADTHYQGVTGTDITVHILDFINPDLIFNKTTVNVNESGPTSDTYTVKLIRKPTNTVTVTLKTPDGQTQVSPSVLNFTSSTWNSPQTVTVTAVDDHVAEGSPHTGIITHQMSGDPFFTGTAGNQTASITDNDTAGITVSTGNVSVTEASGGNHTATYNVKLSSQPLADVTVTPRVDNGQVTVSGPLTFTATTWNVNQPITVTAVQDATPEGTQTSVITNTASSSNDIYYNPTAASPTVTVTVADDDPGIVLTKTNITTDEANQTVDTFGVFLSMDPATGQGNNYVTARVKPPNAGAGGVPQYQVEISLDGATWQTGNKNLPQFTSANYSNPVTVYVRALDDDVSEPDPHTATITVDKYSGNASFDNAPTVTATIADNDTPGVAVYTTPTTTPVQVAVNEQGQTTADYWMVLRTRPTGNVRVNVTADLNQVTINGNDYKTFTSSNWDTPQKVTVKAVDDDIAEANPHTSLITHTIDPAHTNDAAYTALTGLTSVTASINDNDTAGLVISPATATVTEGGTTDTFTVKLLSQPVNPVTVTLTAANGQVSLSPTSLTFNTNPTGAGSWNVTQTVTVTAVDDSAVEGTHTDTINVTSTSTDPNYQEKTGSVSATITDNDLGVLFGSVPTLAEGGPPQTYTIQLSKAPANGAARIRVVLSNSDTPNQLTGINPTSVTFSLNGTNGTQKWDVPKQITVQAVDDSIVEGNHTGTMHYAFSCQSGNCSAWDNRQQDQQIPITDNDH